MKRTFVFVFTLLLGILMTGCSSGEQNESDKIDTNSEPDIEGYVFKVEDDEILVAEDMSSEEYENVKDTPISDFDDPDDADLIYINYDDTSKFEKGDEVKAWIGEDIKESYPRQTDGKKISLKK